MTETGHDKIHEMLKARWCPLEAHGHYKPLVVALAGDCEGAKGLTVWVESLLPKPGGKVEGTKEAAF